MEEPKTKLEEGLFWALRALDTQTARAVNTRTPLEREFEGVSKTGVHLDKVEHVSGTVLEWFGENAVGIDSLIILSQSLVKCLKVVCEELGPEGLGDLRSSYCLAALKHVESDARLAQSSLSAGETLLL